MDDRLLLDTHGVLSNLIESFTKMLNKDTKGILNENW